ncbi:MAG: GumC family protein [Thermoanaerobaculia bacterium]
MPDEAFGTGESAAADEGGAGFNLAEYWQVVVKRWKLVAACVVVFLGWSVLNTVLTPPSYRATAVIDIEQDRGNPLDVGSTTQMFFAYNPDYLPTQLRLLTSREMAERAAERLNLVADQGPAAKSGGLKGQPAQDQGRTVDDAITRTAIGIQGGISVNQIKDTNLVELSYVDSNPKRAADIANAVSEAYIDWTAESKYRAIGEASRYLSSQIEQLRSELETKQKELLQFGGQKNLGGMDSQIVSTLQGTDSMKNEYATAVADRIAKQARYDEVRNAPDSKLAESTNSPLITQARTDQAKLEREYAEKLNVFKPEWPAMRQLKTDIDKGRQRLNSLTKDAAEKEREAAKTDYLTAVRREEGFKDAVRTQRQQAVQFTSSSIEYNNLRVEVDTKRNLLDALLKKQTEMEMISRTTGERVTPVRIVDPALTPTYRFSPSYRHNASRGLVLGMGLGLALCFFLEYLDRSLRTIEQVENFLKLPALGVIPAVAGPAAGGYGYGYGYGSRRKSLKAKKTNLVEGDESPIELLPHTQPRSTVAEAYRAVRTALLLSRAGGVKSITVTSCLPREGKSVTTANLAVVFGQLGKRVLVVDADMHKPRAHEILRVSNRAGLVSVLAENVDPSSVIVKTSIPDVYVLPAGPISPNPSGLLSSPAMTEFLARAAVTFDFVIIDTPPVLPVADAIVIGHQTDGVVLCVRGGKTAREQVRRMRDKLQRSGVRILGVLINNLEVQPGGKYGGQYSYGAYGYGEEPVKKSLAGASASAKS